MVKKQRDEDEFFEDEHGRRRGRLAGRTGRALRRLVGFPLYLLELFAHSTRRFLRRRLRRGRHTAAWFFGPPLQLLAAVGHGAVAFLWKVTRGPLAAVVWLLGFPLFVIRRVASTLWKFLYRYLASRAYGSLLWGLPAIAGSLAVTLAVALAGQVSDTDLLFRYRHRAQEALNKGDSKAAKLWLEKATLLDPDHPMHQYALALVAEADDRIERARQLMRRIAPADDAGYPAAHFWLAVDLTRQAGPLSPENQQALEHHLQQALTEQPYRSQSHLLLAQLYLFRGDAERAIRHGEQVVADQPALRITLARLYAQQKNTVRAKSELEKAAEHFNRLARDEPENVPARLLWAESQVLLGQWPKAEVILTAGLRTTGDLRFSASLARLYLVQFDQIWKQAPTQRAQALVLLQAAGASAPRDPLVLDRLYLLAFPANPHRHAVQQLLRHAVAKGRPAALAHLLLAIMEVDEGDVESAALHYQVGFQQVPQMIELLGHLATALARMDPPQADRALRLIEAAQETTRDHPALREARGRILAKLGRWQEATEDLQLVLPETDRPALVHDALAEAYEHLAEADQAAAHRRQAAELREPPDTNQAHTNR